MAFRRQLTIFLNLQAKAAEEELLQMKQSLELEMKRLQETNSDEKENLYRELNKVN